MALKGDLASVDLAQVFQMLALNQKVGLLSIQSPDVWRALYFDSRGVTLYYNEHVLVDRVLNHLVRSGRLLDEAVQSARDHAVNMGMTVIDSLLAGGYIDEEQLEDLYRTELEEDVYDLFFWTDARFEFYEGATSFDGREGCISDRLFFSTDSLIMEAARRIDEWAYIREQVSGDREVFSPLDVDVSANLSEGDYAVLDLVDGKRNVERVVEASGLANFHVCKSLAALLDAGAIEYTPPEALADEAVACLEEGRLVDAINLYERAIELEVGIPEVYARLSQAYEAAEEYELATVNLRSLAEHQVEASDLSAAAGNLRRILQLIPTDLDARARLVELAIGEDLRIDGFDPIATGKELVDLYLEMGEVDRVREILERLLRENPHDIELKKILVNVHTKAGDTRRVVELYESLAQDLVARGQTIEGVSFLQKILRIDRSRTDINDRIRSLYRMEERQRSRRRSMVAVALLFVLVAALGVGYLLYDDYARRAFDGIRVEPLIESREYAQAEAIYAEFASSYPLSRAAADARAEQTRVSAMRLAAEAKAEREQAAKQRELGKIRSRYKLAHKRFQEEFRNGQPEAALRTLEGIRAAVRDETNEDADLRWAQAERIEDSYRQLKEFLGGAVALEREARQALDAGEWKKARSLTLKLVREFDITKTASLAKVPVRVESRPSGAQIFFGGEPLLRRGDGVNEPIVTPATIQLAHGAAAGGVAAQELSLHLAGFEDRVVLLDPLERALVDEILTVRPERTTRFSTEVVTGLSAQSGVLAVGLKDGAFGLARQGTVYYEGKLTDLASVQGVPVIAGDRIYYRTNLGALVAHRLADGKTAEGWPIRLKAEPLFEPVVADGRVLIADSDGRLVCLDAVSGQQLWLKPLDGPAGGRPVLLNRRIFIGTQSGWLAVMDASDGQLLRRATDVKVGIATRVQPVDDLLLFGGTDGALRAIDAKGVQVWRRDLGRSLDDDQFLVVDSDVFALDGDSTLVRLRASDGKELARATLAGTPQRGFAVAGDRVAIVFREKGAGKPGQPGQSGQEDAMAVLSRDTLTPLWEYRDGGLFRGSIAVSDNNIFVPASTGEVVSFR